MLRNEAGRAAQQHKSFAQMYSPDMLSPVSKALAAPYQRYGLPKWHEADRQVLLVIHHG